MRGVIADNLITHPRGFRAINDEEFGDWVIRHGGHPDVLESAFVRGLYDLVFGYDQADPQRPAVAAGVMVFLIGFVLFEYKGAIFWKMTAGMGDVVMAPLYQALRRRGVKFEFFHRVDALHLDPRRQTIDAITMGRQLRLADGVDEYDPLTTVRGLPVFPNAPLAEQIQARDGLDELESHFAKRDDVETSVLRRGKDFDHVVLAVSAGDAARRGRGTHRRPAGMARNDNACPHDRDTGVPAVAAPRRIRARMAETRRNDHRLRPPVRDVGLDAADALGRRLARRGSSGHGCLLLRQPRAPWPATEDHDGYVRRYRTWCTSTPPTTSTAIVGLYYPNAVTEQGFAWHLLCGADGQRGPAALATQHVSVNIDPSDRYVQSVPGSDQYRLRPDESGYDNLVLAGDWTDCGMNAGCIEAAVMSGLEAANALLGRGRYHRIRGFWVP